MAIEFDAREIARTIGNEIAEVREIIGTEFVRDVVPRTPVLTGHARRNWQANFGSPTRNELPGVDKSGQATISTGISRIKAGKQRNPFLPLVIENNVPYIGRLNAGSSRQAPAMFVELAINLTINRVPQRKNI